MKKEKTKRYLIIFLKTTIAFLAIWVLFKSEKLTKESFTNLFQAHNIPFILLSSLAYVSSQLLATSRLSLLLRAIDFHLRFFQGFKLNIIGNFFNIIIPGLTGGDLVKGYFLIRDEENNKGSTSGIIIMDRVLGILALGFLSGISIIYLLQLNNANLNIYHRKLYYIMVAIGALFCFFIVFLVFGSYQHVRGKLKTIFTKIFRNSILYYVVHGFGILIRKRRVLICSFLISISMQLITLSGLICLAKLTSGNVPGLLTLMAVSSVVMLLGSIPVTPGNIGWTELIAAFGWSAVGSDTGAEIFLYWRVVTVFCSLPGLYFFMAQRRAKAPKNHDYSVLESGENRGYKS
ncbi:MAG: flippase-like domain-containing protein [Candidatus Scalindua sp.]|nr:flippase-like domain-containing protein [Candidatus Scalindua sp.]